MRNLLILAFGLVIGLVATAEAAPCTVVHSLGEVKFFGCSQVEKSEIETALQAIETSFSLEEDLKSASKSSAEYYRRKCRRKKPSLKGFDRCASSRSLVKKLEVDFHQLRWYVWEACRRYSSDLDSLSKCGKIIGFDGGRGPGWLVEVIERYQDLKAAKAEAAQTLKQYKSCRVGKGGIGIKCAGAGPLALWGLIVAFFRRWREEKEPLNSDDETVSLAPIDPLALPGDRGRRREWIIPTLTTAFVVFEVVSGDWVGALFGLGVFLIERWGVFK